jgi:uncharacterized membrane protein
MRPMHSARSAENSRRDRASRSAHPRNALNSLHIFFEAMRRAAGTPVAQLEANWIVAARCETEIVVSLIVYYVVFMIAGDFAAYFIGLFVEYEWGQQVSLIVFLALYFLFLWVSWLLAVWMTEPKETGEAAG